MKLEKITLYLLCLTLCVLSCNNDDGDNGGVVVEVRDRVEQQLADIDSLQKYLKSHYYNKSAFDGNSNAKIADMVISEAMAEDNISSDADSLLINVVDSLNTTFAETDYKLYILKLNQGGGEESPSFADKILVTYEGFTLDNEVFDSAVTPVEFNLVGDGVNTSGLIPGWRKVLPNFNIAESFVENGDGTVDYMNYGMGVMFLPSGLAYFSNAVSGIPSYTPISFKFELFGTRENDHDADGIPSYFEDLNGDGEFTVNSEDNTDTTDDDTDGDLLPNYFDTDDDGDGIPTSSEIETRTVNESTIAALEALVGQNEILTKVTRESDNSYSGVIVDLDPDDDGVKNYLDESS